MKTKRAFVSLAILCAAMMLAFVLCACENQSAQTSNTSGNNSSVASGSSGVQTDEPGGESIPEGQLVYLDNDNLLELYYPDMFGAEMILKDDYYITFQSDKGVLYYWVLDSTEDDPEERNNAIDYKDMGDGSMVAWAETMDQLTGEYSYEAFLWILKPEKYFNAEKSSCFANVAVVCETEEEAQEWYQEFLAGAVSLRVVDGN